MKKVKTAQEAQKAFLNLLNRCTDFKKDDTSVAEKLLGQLGFICQSECSSEREARTGGLIVDLVDVFIYDEDGEMQLVGGYSWKYWDKEKSRYSDGSPKEPNKKYWHFSI